MNYYEFHIGDFNAATRHLTRIERSIYRDMIDMYYDTESPLPLDLKILNRKIMARSEEEQEAVLAILDEFFIKTESGYFNSRCDDCIQKYHNNTSAKSLAGKASAAKREQERIERLKLLNNVKTENQQDSTDVQQALNSVGTEIQPIPTNHKPLTINQEPLTNINNNNSASAIFEISSDWTPLEPSFSELLADMEIPLSKHTPKTLKDYILHCRAKDPDKQNTQGQWQLFYAKWLQRERDPVPVEPNQAQPTKKTSERHVLGVPISRISAEARPGETEEDCAKRLKNQSTKTEKPAPVVKLADDRPAYEIFAEKQRLRQQQVGAA